MIAERIMQSAGNAKEHKGLRSEQLEDEQRQAREQQIWQDPGLNTAQKAQGIDMLYAHEPVESRLGRIKRGFERMTGQGKKADEQKKQADSQIASQKESIYGYGSKMDPNYPVKTVTDSAASYTDPNTGVAQTIPGTGATTKIGLAAPNRNIQEGLRGLMAQSNPNLQAQQKADFERSQLAPDKIAQVKAADAALDALGINDPNVRQRARDAALGSKAPNAPYKTYVNKSTGERQAFRVGEQPDEDWEIDPMRGTSRPVPYTAGSQSLAMAKKIRDMGQSFPDKEGKDWDLDAIPEGANLFPVFEPGGKEYWSVSTDKGRYETAGNQRLFEPAVGPPNPNAPSIGPARVGTTASSVTPGPAGPVVTNRSTTPNTIPAPGVRGGGASSAAPMAHGGAARPAPSQINAPAPRSSSEGTPPIRDPKMPPMRGADEQRIASVAAPMAVVEQQVVGRGAKPLWEYSSVLNNPEMVKTVNLAMAAPLLQTPQGDKGISFWGTVATAMGLAGAAQKATTETIVDARNRVQQQGGPEAVEFLDRLAELKGSIPNMKKVQGGSAAMGSLEPLYQESPIMNISSPEDFRNRTANMVRTMAAALEQTPGINKQHVDWLYSQADKAQGRSNESNPPAPKKQTNGSRSKSSENDPLGVL